MIRFQVDGIPTTQGSMKHIGHGRIIHDKPAPLKAWRRAIEVQAQQAMRNREIIDVACTVNVVFALPRPKSRKRSRHADRKPDLDKLQRAVGDALEGVVFTQDSRVTRWTAMKRYADEGEETGVSVMVWELST